MHRSDWLVGGDRRSAAAERIYAAATDLITRDGMDALDIDALAARVHCSRATIYRCAGGKRQIRDVVMVRAASRIVESVRRAVDGLTGAERIVTAITVALGEIRSDPLGHLVFNAIRARKSIASPSRPAPGISWSNRPPTSAASSATSPPCAIRTVWPAMRNVERATALRA